MFAASKTASVAAAAPVDAQFNYVTMLLHGDGTNGAQNNTFLDSSTNNFTITRNGNTTQGSFSPYGSNWSNYFDGSAAYITTSASAISYASDFTVECWFNTTTTTTYASIYSDESAVSGGTILLNNGTNNGQITVYIAAAVLNFASTSTGLNNGKWNHVALSRSGSTLRLFINGVLENTTTALGTLATPSTFRIANSYYGSRLFGGYISNFRVTNTAVYTSSFTPSTTPLTAISGTSLLTCQSNRFIDNSTNNFAITVAGGAPSVQRFNPFGTSTAYSTSVIGGSGYFDGTGDYLGVSSAAIAATGQFCIEAWVYQTGRSVSTSQGIYSQYTGGVSGRFYFRFNSDKLSFTTSAGDNIGASTLITSTWYHVAVTRDASNVLRLFVNGVLDYNATVTQSLQVTTPQIGAIAGGECWQGYLTDVRTTSGSIPTAYQTSSTTNGTSIFTPNTSPLTAITNTSLLTNYTNGAIFDNAMMNDLETVGNAQISTSVVKYGTGSLAFDGSGDYLISGNYLNSTFGTGDFTIEMWLYYSSSATGSDFVIDCRPTSVNGAYPAIYIDSGVMYYYVDTANRITSSAISTNTWMHVAVCRSGTSTKMFINGTQTGSTYTDSTNYICRTDGPVIGADRNFGDSLLGYIDDFRITKGYARYTTTFTPPTAAFPNIGPV